MEVFESHPEKEHSEAVKAVPERKADEHVVHHNLQPVLAFEQFAGKLFDPTGQLSDNSVRAYIRHTTSSRAEYSSSSKPYFESPFERYNRLKNEMAQFEQDMKELVGEASSGPAGEVAQFMFKDLSGLSGRLSELVSSSAVQRVLNPVPESSTFNELAASVQKQRGATDADTALVAQARAPAASSDEATQRRIAELDRRLASMERTVGSAAADDLHYPDVASAIAQLRIKTRVVDDDKAEAACKKARALLGELEKLEEKLQEQDNKLRGANSPHEERIKVLYDLMMRWDATAQQVPAVVQRLWLLKHLHEEAATLVSRVQRVEAQQADTTATAHHCKELLQKLLESAGQNAELMAKNSKHLETRIQALLEKTSKLGL